MAKNQKEKTGPIKEAEGPIVPEAASTMPATEAVVAPEEANARNLAEMYYYTDAAPGQRYSDLNPELQDAYAAQARKVYRLLDKLNLMVVPKRDLTLERLNDVKQVKAVIDAFVATMNKPKDLHKIFPSEELANRIVDGRIR